MEGINPVPYTCTMFHDQKKNNMEKNVIVFEDKYQNINWVFDWFEDKFIHPDKADLNQEKFWFDTNQVPEWVTEIAVKDFGMTDYPELVSKYLKVQVYGFETFDIHFNNDENSNSKGFKESYAYCLEYIEQRNSGTYFDDYQGGIVSIVCNETGETVFEKSI